MIKMQITPWKPCTETLVSRSRKKNRGNITDTVEPQELRLQYRNRDWTEKSVPYQHQYKTVLKESTKIVATQTYLLFW